MNEIEIISRLARSAGDEPVLQHDLADGVIASLQNHRPSDDDRMWTAFAGAGCVLAVLAVIAVAQSWSFLSNPLSDLRDFPMAAMVR